MGDIKKQGLQNTAIVNLAVIIGFVSTLLIQPRFLKPEEIGLIKILYSCSLLISTIIPLGMVNAGYKFFPQFRNKDKKHHGFFLFMMLFPVVGFLVTTSGLLSFRQFIISYYSVNSALFAEFFDYVFPLSFFLAFLSVLSVYSSSLFKSTFPTFLSEIGSKLMPVLVVSAYYLKWINIDGLVLFYVLGYGILVIALLAYIISIDKPFARIDRSKFTRNKLTEILMYSLSFSFVSFASMGLKQLEAPLMGAFLPLYVVGIYATVVVIPVVIEMPLHAFEKIAGAKISDALTHGRMDEVKTIYYRLSKYLFLIGGLLFLGITLNIHKLLWLLPKEKGFWEGENVVYIVSIGTLFNMATSVNNPILFNSKYYRYGLGLLAFLIVVSFINYRIFIPMWGMEGAAFATALSGVSYNFLKFFFIWRKMGMQPFDINSLKTFLLIFVCGLLWFVNIDVGSATVEIALMSILITVIYVTGAYFLNIVPELFATKNFEEIRKRIGL